MYCNIEKEEMRVKRIEKVDKNCRRNKMFPVYEQKKENVHILQKTSRHAPPHLHNSVEFIYVISGSMEIGMGQELFHMDEGDFAVIFPDVIHHYQVFEKGKNKSIYGRHYCNKKIYRKKRRKKFRILQKMCWKNDQ